MKRTVAYFNKIILLKFLILGLLIAICFGCSSKQSEQEDAVSTAKMEVLPPDGGELGKAYLELIEVLKTADKVKVEKLLEPRYVHLLDQAPSLFEDYYDDFSTYKKEVVGGRRQGNRATLFLFGLSLSKSKTYSFINATYNKDGWQFDTPTPRGSYPFTEWDQFTGNCQKNPNLFPCAVMTGPDSQVSGTIHSYETYRNTNTPIRTAVLLDGFAVKLIDPKTKSLKSIQVILSPTGINPEMVARCALPADVIERLGESTLTLDVTPDGKSAKLEYVTDDGDWRKKFDINNSELNIDTSTPNRIRGHLKLDEKDAAKFNVKFDIGTVSDCIHENGRCAPPDSHL